MAILNSYVSLPEGIYRVGGWALPLWKMIEFVSWDDEIPNWMEIHKIHVPNHQASYIRK